MASFRTDIPQRIDRLPWSRWHWTVVIGLGITWILDGLEVTLVGSVGPRLQDRATLGLSAADVGLSATAYLAGAVAGALVFGYLTDRFGRRKLFIVTLGWYIAATLLTATSWNVWSFVVFRFLTGLGIGGEYGAINSTIDELIPSAKRGFVDLAINGTYWLGAMLGSGASILLLDPHVVDQRWGWRVAFGIGALLAFGVVFLREGLPESPRWLLTHDRAAAAERTVAAIERTVRAQRGGRELPAPRGSLDLDPARRHGLADVWRTMLRTYPQRSIVVLALMIAQAFLYNAFFFTESLLLTTFFAVPAKNVGYYIFPFAAGNLLGAVLLGPLFDRVGRKPMIVLTYGGSGLLLLATGWAFERGLLDATTITLCWCVTFFFASAGASAAYLTVSEIFPLEIRAMAIALVYSVGTLAGGALGPALFGALIATRSAGAVFAGYGLATALMVAAAGLELWLGVEGAGRTLEAIAAPLGAAPEPGPRQDPHGATA
jgi:MFS family permease